MEDGPIFSRESKISILKEIASGKLSKEEARRKYDIKGHSTILKWQRRIEVEGIDLRFEKPKKIKKSIDPLIKSKEPEGRVIDKGARESVAIIVDSDRVKEVESRVKELENLLAEERFKSSVYQIFVEVLDEEES